MDMHRSHDGPSSDQPEADAFLTVAEVAAMSQVSKMTIYRLVHAGELEAVRLGRSFRIRESAARALSRRGRFAVAGDPEQGDRRRA
jgi:excisionase family DNA binding protein